MLVIKEHKKLLLNLNDPDRVTTVIPTAKAVEVKGHTLVSVPHRMEEVRVLRNMGFDAPAPMGSYYDWPGMYKPFIHQKVTAEFLTMNPKSFCLNGMGSGKTMSVLWAFDYLKKLGMVNRMLVLGPLSTLERTWGDEIFKHFPELTFTVLHGTREKRHKLLANDFDIYIINHDGIKSKETVQLLREREGLDVICVDEVASFRNASTDRWKSLWAICKDKDWVWGLTGTPTPNAPTDAWAQVRLISPTRVPKYFGVFREQVMRPLSKFKWTPREGSLEVVRQAMQPSVRFSREECIDLPPTTLMTRQTELTPEQRTAYYQMLTKMKVDFADGQVTAVNEAAKLTKLLQIVCGTAYTQDGEVSIPSQHRINLVKEIIEEAGAKVIVFVPFTGALNAVAEEIAKDFSVELIHGGVSKTERDRIFGAFQKTKEPRVLVANAAAMSHGLTLTAANTIVWFAPINSLEIYEQANARIVRPGQKMNTLIVNIEGSDLERKMYARLQHKGKMQGLLLELLKGESE
jgi:SNF2 family DNA or RNA helicase